MYGGLQVGLCKAFSKHILSHSFITPRLLPMAHNAQPIKDLETMLHYRPFGVRASCFFAGSHPPGWTRNREKHSRIPNGSIYTRATVVSCD